MHRVRAIADGDPANLTHLALGAHTGTHVDAPAHFLDGAPTLEQIPSTVSWVPPRCSTCAGCARSMRLPCVRTSSRRAASCSSRPITPSYGEAAVRRRVHPLTLDAAQLLVSRGVRTVGIDYLSIERFGSKDFAVHKHLLGHGVPIIEGLDLRAVGAGSYALVCLPLNLQHVDGAPARAILLQ